MASGTQTYVGVWYPEDPEHGSAMSALKESTDIEYVAILHDKDVDADGNFKKKHWHVVVRFPFQKSLSAAAKSLGVPQNYIQESSNYLGALRYLLHLDDPDKAQYSHDELFGPLSSKVPYDTLELSEGEKVLIILDLIDELPHPCTVGQMIRALSKAGFYGELRRGGAFFLRVLDEHNAFVPNFVTIRSYENTARQSNFRSFVEGYEAKKRK